MKRNSLILTAAALAGTLLTASAAKATVLWQSDFIKKGLEQFDIYDVGPQINPEFTQSSGPSKWSVKDGALHQDSNIYGNPDPADGSINNYTGTHAVVKNFTAQDGIFFIQFKTGDDDGISLVFRWQDEKNFMRFESLRDPGNGGPITRLEKWTNGVMTILDSTTDVVYQQNVRETMLVVAKGGQMEAYVADLNAPLLKATDTDPKPGRFGVGLYAEHPLDITSLEALSPDSSLYVATLNDKSNTPLGDLWVRLTSGGKTAAGIFTNPAGQALFLDVAPGSYDLSTGGLNIVPVPSQKADVKAGVSAGTFTFDIQQATTPNPSATIKGTIKDPTGKPLEGVSVSAFSPDTEWGPQTGTATTAADGTYTISGLAAGTYTVTRNARLDLDPAAEQTQTVSGAVNQTVTADFTTSARPQLVLSSDAGSSWLVAYGTDPAANFSAVNLPSEASDFQDVTVPGTLESAGLGEDHSFFWYRLHITLPDSFKAFQGRDLILTGFNVDDADVAYFNGTKIGSSGKFPTDPADPDNTGYVGTSGDVRTYTIPASLVNWTGDNVLAINGYENGGDSGITAGTPTLIVAGGGTTPTVTLGDLNADGKVNVQDATTSLRIAVGSITPTDAQKAAGDVNHDGKWNVQDTTLILRFAVGAITAFP